MLPLVSVIIPLYNREKTIQRAVDSVLNQTYTNIEVIVVDDGSTDDSVKMLHKYVDDNRVKVFCQPQNKGANAARNRGIREARGEYIAFHDSDDAWLPDKLEKQIRCMERDEFYVSFCAFKRHYEGAVQIVPNISEQLSCESIRERLRRGNIVGTPTLVLHKSVVSAVGVFDEEMPRLQDYEYMIRIVKKYDVCFVNEVLVNEYELDRCISLNQTSLNQAYALLIKKHADFLDVDYLWGAYLDTGNEVETHRIHWEKLDQIIDDIMENNRYCTKEKLYKATAQHFHLKYTKLKVYEEQKYNNLLQELKTRKFVIYGAGNYARKVINSLKNMDLVPECFLVTQKEGTDNINGIPVLQLSEWSNNTVTVIVAVTGNAQNDIIQNLEKRGMYQYCIYPECF